CLCLCFIWDSHFGFPNISLSFVLDSVIETKLLSTASTIIFEFKDARKIKESYNCQIWYFTFYSFPFLVSFLFAMIPVDPYHILDILICIIVNDNISYSFFYNNVM
ncbi:hypothetical protein ACJX0J_011024, partial [Zea mays]